MDQHNFDSTPESHCGVWNVTCIQENKCEVI